MGASLLLIEVAAIVDVAEHAELFALLNAHLRFPSIFHGFTFSCPPLPIGMVGKRIGGSGMLLEIEGRDFPGIAGDFKQFLFREASRIARVGGDEFHVIGPKGP